MKKADVKIGSSYVVKVSGNLAPVRIDAESPHGGWIGTNTKTGRQVRIRTAARLRILILTTHVEKPLNRSGTMISLLVAQGRTFNGARRGAKALFS